MNLTKTTVLVAFCLLILAADIFSKGYTFCCIAPIHTSVYPFGGIRVFQDFLGVDFSLNYVENKGAAWGIFSSFQNYLLYLRIGIILVLITYLVMGKKSFFRKLAFALIVTGAIGNVIDYFVYGHVVDMFYFRFWGYSYPVFNVADSSIFIGICLLFIDSLKKNKK